MSRLAQLQARRQALINRCEEQRLELAYRLAQIKPREQLSAWTRRSATGVGQNPLAWAAGLAALVWMLRRRRTLRGVGWLTGLVALSTRARTFMRVLVQLRAVYRGFKMAQAFRQQPRGRGDE